eukprot:g17009.t1
MAPKPKNLPKKIPMKVEKKPVKKDAGTNKAKGSAAANKAAKAAAAAAKDKKKDAAAKKNRKSASATASKNKAGESKSKAASSAAKTKSSAKAAAAGDEDDDEEDDDDAEDCDDDDDEDDEEEEEADGEDAAADENDVEEDDSPAAKKARKNAPAAGGKKPAVGAADEDDEIPVEAEPAPQPARASSFVFPKTNPQQPPQPLEVLQAKGRLLQDKTAAEKEEHREEMIRKNLGFKKQFKWQYAYVESLGLGEDFEIFMGAFGTGILGVHGFGEAELKPGKAHMILFINPKDCKVAFAPMSSRYADRYDPNTRVFRWETQRSDLDNRRILQIQELCNNKRATVRIATREDKSSTFHDMGIGSRAVLAHGARCNLKDRQWVQIDGNGKIHANILQDCLPKKATEYRVPLWVAPIRRTLLVFASTQSKNQLGKASLADGLKRQLWKADGKELELLRKNDLAEFKRQRKYCLNCCFAPGALDIYFTENLSENVANFVNLKEGAAPVRHRLADANKKLPKALSGNVPRDAFGRPIVSKMTLQELKAECYLGGLQAVARVLEREGRGRGTDEYEDIMKKMEEACGGTSLVAGEASSSKANEPVCTPAELEEMRRAREDLGMDENDEEVGNFGSSVAFGGAAAEGEGDARDYVVSDRELNKKAHHATSGFFSKEGVFLFHEVAGGATSSSSRKMKSASSPEKTTRVVEKVSATTARGRGDKSTAAAVVPWNSRVRGTKVRLPSPEDHGGTAGAATSVEYLKVSSGEFEGKLLAFAAGSVAGAAQQRLLFPAPDATKRMSAREAARRDRKYGMEAVLNAAGSQLSSPGGGTAATASKKGGSKTSLFEVASDDSGRGKSTFGERQFAELAPERVEKTLRKYCSKTLRANPVLPPTGKKRGGAPAGIYGRGIPGVEERWELIKHYASVQRPTVFATSARQLRIEEAEDDGSSRARKGGAGKKWKISAGEDGYLDNRDVVRFPDEDIHRAADADGIEAKDATKTASAAPKKPETLLPPDADDMEPPKSDQIKINPPAAGAANSNFAWYRSLTAASGGRGGFSSPARRGSDELHAMDTFPNAASATSSSTSGPNTTKNIGLNLLRMRTYKTLEMDPDAQQHYQHEDLGRNRDASMQPLQQEDPQANLLKAAEHYCRPRFDDLTTESSDDEQEVQERKALHEVAGAGPRNTTRRTNTCKSAVHRCDALLGAYPCSDWTYTENEYPETEVGTDHLYTELDYSFQSCSDSGGSDESEIGEGGGRRDGGGGANCGYNPFLGRSSALERPLDEVAAEPIIAEGLAGKENGEMQPGGNNSDKIQHQNKMEMVTLRASNFEEGDSSRKLGGGDGMANENELADFFGLGDVVGAQNARAEQILATRYRVAYKLGEIVEVRDWGEDPWRLAEVTQVGSASRSSDARAEGEVAPEGEVDPKANLDRDEVKRDSVQVKLLDSVHDEGVGGAAANKQASASSSSKRRESTSPATGQGRDQAPRTRTFRFIRPLLFAPSQPVSVQTKDRVWHHGYVTEPSGNAPRVKLNSTNWALSSFASTEIGPKDYLLLKAFQPGLSSADQIAEADWRRVRRGLAEFDLAEAGREMRGAFQVEEGEDAKILFGGTTTTSTQSTKQERELALLVAELGRNLIAPQQRPADTSLESGVAAALEHKMRFSQKIGVFSRFKDKVRAKLAHVQREKLRKRRLARFVKGEHTVIRGGVGGHGEDLIGGGCTSEEELAEEEEKTARSSEIDSEDMSQVRDAEKIAKWLHGDKESLRIFKNSGSKCYRA